MPDIVQIVQAGAVNPWFYLPVAMALGALHALEPGHAKSLMAAFLIAIRGTERQAVTLGLSAAVGHTIVVWMLTILVLMFGDKLIVERAEPWLVLLSGLLIAVLAARVVGMTVGWTGGHDHHHHSHPDPHQHHDHGHHHGHSLDHDRGHGHTHDPQEVARNYAGRTVSTGEVA